MRSAARLRHRVRKLRRERASARGNDVQFGLPATGIGEGSAGSTGGRECPGRSGLFMLGATPDADILGLMRAEDGSHGLRARAPDTLVPLRPPLTFNLALRVRCGEGLVDRSRSV